MLISPSLLVIFLFHKTFSKPRVVHSNIQEFEQVMLKASMNEQGTSADVERKHTKGESGNRLPSTDTAQECRDGIKKVKLKLVRDVRKNRRGFLKYNNNKRVKKMWTH